MAFDLRKLLGKEETEEYVEIDLGSAESKDNKIFVKLFDLKQFDDINDILNSLREGYTVAIINIRPLKTKDIIELKRAVSKIKKTVDALEGSVAGFKDDTIIAVPKFAEIHRQAAVKKEKPDFLS